MQTSASPSMFRSLWAALCRSWHRALQTLAARRAQAVHQRRMAEELLGMSEREMLDLAIGRGEMASWLQARTGLNDKHPKARRLPRAQSVPAQVLHRQTPAVRHRKLTT